MGYGPPGVRFLNPIHAVRNLMRQRHLIWAMARRDVEQRYRGSFLGLLWSFLTPLLTLGVYTFVFSVLFRARWSSNGSESRADFALITFCGIIAFNIFAESVLKAPATVTSNVNYVKKIVFPTETLPLSVVVASAVQAVFSLMVLGVGLLVAQRQLTAEALLLPLAFAPIFALSAGFALLLASLGVFLRDTAHLVAAVTPLLLFMSAVLYPVSALPDLVRPYAVLNPLIPMIENVRACVLDDIRFDWQAWGITVGISLLSFLLGYAWFMRTKPWFADVL